MSRDQRQRNKTDRVNEILERLRAGESRQEISAQFDYSTWKSLDIYMRRRGFTWDGRRQIYSNALVDKATQEIVTITNHDRKDDLVSVDPEEILRLFRTKIHDTRKISKMMGFSGHKEMASFMRRRGYVWSSTESNYTGFAPIPLTQSPANNHEIPEPFANISDKQPGVKLNEKLSEERYIILLDFLWKHQDNLAKLIDSTRENEGNKICIYHIPGSAKTKSIFLSDELSNLMTSFCKEKGISQKQGFEGAVIEYLTKYGNREQIEKLL